ncbi:MAG: hypothetical protein FJ138_18250, partial [Deltaproteobacteria bacterium]|nr:hypothetical protein [Deltaproteobacteria bacterium]
MSHTEPHHLHERATLTLHLLHLAQRLLPLCGAHRALPRIAQESAEALLHGAVHARLSAAEACALLRDLSCTLRLAALDTIACAEALVSASRL